MTDERQRCPHDGGTCHHSCGKDPCFREEGGMYLTEPWPGYPLPGHKNMTEERAVEVLATQHVLLAVARGIEGMGLNEFFPESALALEPFSSKVIPRSEMLKAFKALIAELYKRSNG